MVKYPEADEIRKILTAASGIVIVQADNPDIDSLASSLALEEILGNLGKEVYLYCGVDLPSYLQYVPGWDRVSSDMPKRFDAAIIVDTSSDSLLTQLDKNGAKSWLSTRPVVVLDHHGTGPTINFAKVICNHEAVATAEIIYELAGQLDWKITKQAGSLIAMAMLSDSLGLMSESTTARSIQIIAELVKLGVSLPEIDNARRETLRREPELIGYKGQLLQRVEYHDGSKIATLSIPWEEIERYSPLYNPSMLVIDDMRLAKGNALAICYKLYKDGKITAKIRCNYGYPIADKLAEHFGGGGHPLASGFKLTDGRPFDEVKTKSISLASELLRGIENKQK